MKIHEKNDKILYCVLSKAFLFRPKIPKKSVFDRNFDFVAIWQTYILCYHQIISIFATICQKVPVLPKFAKKASFRKICQIL